MWPFNWKSLSECNENKTATVYCNFVVWTSSTYKWLNVVYWCSILTCIYQCYVLIQLSYKNLSFNVQKIYNTSIANQLLNYANFSLTKSKQLKTLSVISSSPELLSCSSHGKMVFAVPNNNNNNNNNNIDFIFTIFETPL